MEELVDGKVETGMEEWNRLLRGGLACAWMSRFRWWNCCGYEISKGWAKCDKSFAKGRKRKEIALYMVDREKVFGRGLPEN